MFQVSIVQVMVRFQGQEINSLRLNVSDAAGTFTGTIIDDESK